ncbi:MAG: hypothetical protein SFY81_08935 [Verrucomicrobiota bacterium]|nr:hypothetical protein [Verrucomicrobiota bacterium]
MDFLKIFSRGAPTTPMPLPTGTFTVDRFGKLITSTVSQSFPEKYVLEIGEAVIAIFRQAMEAEVPLTEITLTFASLKITARELRGGAIVFLSPLGLGGS